MNRYFAPLSLMRLRTVIRIRKAKSTVLSLNIYATRAPMAEEIEQCQENRYRVPLKLRPIFMIFADLKLVTDP